MTRSAIPRKTRNQQIYYAAIQTASKQLSCALSKELRKKYGKRSARIIEGDTAKIVRGEFTGVDGKVTKISIPDRGVNIEGVKKEKLKGEKFDVYVHTSNIILTGLDSGDKWRINKLEGKKATAARADEKPKVETTKSKEEPKDTKKATKTKTTKGDNKE
ncbi:MAG: 50S ribosomal protein L24 [Crenarchaeota archaeon]|nr:50S ribosomal protein L24 [Thermoproteota archaeon]MDA1124342.1 50S ribosomal protein L24 [Thermoproteota archaeon]